MFCSAQTADAALRTRSPKHFISSLFFKIVGGVAGSGETQKCFPFLKLPEFVGADLRELGWL